MANPRWAETPVPRYLPDRVAQLYYAHGLFCSSHPVLVITLTITIILVCCYPLLSLPIPGNMPQYFVDPPLVRVNTQPLPKWMNGSPKLYVQQVVLKSSISPWNDDLITTDAFRGPLAECFKLLEIIHNYQHYNSSLSLDNLCLHVETVKHKSNKVIAVMPEYNCLILSPSNLWNQDFNRFQLDTNLINTIYSYQNLAKGKVTVSEMLFGLSLKDAGIKRYPLRSKQRVIRFAITIFMTQYRPLYIKGLQDYLNLLYPLHQSSEGTDSISNLNNSLHIYYPEDTDYSELVPLSITYIMLFLYMYYLVRKMEHIRSKVGMAFVAVFTLLASLSTTVGICFFFGLEFSDKGPGKQVFPYLVIVVGLENMLVLTKSVVSTLPHLDSKIRVAQGLSKEGWNITTTLLTLVTILTFGLITFVPVIQEFCIFAIVGILSDFFLQMVFFATILSIDIRCTEHSTFPQYSYYTLSSPFPLRHLNTTHSSLQYTDENRRTALPRSRSQPKLLGQNVIASVRNQKSPEQNHVPKRVKVVHLWARTRIVQRCFMICMVGWLAAIVYNNDAVRDFFRFGKESEPEEISSENQKRYNVPPVWERSSKSSILEMEMRFIRAAEEAKNASLKQELLKNQENSTGQYAWLNRIDYDVRRRVSFHHWSSILSLYNMSVSGSYITVLPPIHLAQPVSPEKAHTLRNPDEKGVQLRWQSLAIALDPLDFADLGSTIRSPVVLGDSDNILPLVPSSPMELMMTALLCIISVLVIAYVVINLYRVICSRNYAEWRTSWTISSSDDTTYATQIVLEAVPVPIEGHSQQIECIATDGNVIVSTCLMGQVKVWDAVTGEFVANINRSDLKSMSNIETRDENLNYGYQNKDDNYLTTLLPDRNHHLNTFSTLKQDQPNSSYWCNNSVASHMVVHRGHKKLPFSIIEGKQSIVSSSDTFNSHMTNGLDGNSDSSPDIETAYERTRCLDRRKTSNSTIGTGASTDNVSNEEYNNIQNILPPPIWCLDCKDNLAVLGCANGTIEFWECTTGVLKCIYEEEDNISVTAIKIVGGRIVIASKLNGALCFYRLDVFSSNQTTPPYNLVTKHRRGHTRSGSMGSIIDWPNIGTEEVHCSRIECTKAHSHPITVLEVEGGRVITGSQDHTLKVFNLEDQSLLYALHGHCGPITCIFIDRINPTIAGSGSQDGLLCVWDLHTGTCMYSIQAHDGTICALAYSASYVISLGQDERLCVWDRFQGHLLKTISSGCLLVIDVGTGEPVRIVKLGHSDDCVFVRQIINLGDAIVCDYGDQLRLVRFPLACDKSE